MLVAVDIGNTLTKFGRFEPDAPPLTPPSDVLRWPTADDPADELAAWLPAEPVRWAVSSVQRAAAARLAAWVAAQRPRDAYRPLSHADAPLAIDVAEPARVGLDRLACAAAVDRLRTPGRPAIFVTAGTAVTVNLLRGDGALAGGAILPGAPLGAAVLAGKTDALPLVELVLEGEPPPACGRSTTAAIASGLYWGLVGALRTLIDELSRELAEPPELFFTGGDGERFAHAVRPDVRYVAELTLLGVRCIDDYLSARPER